MPQTTKKEGSRTTGQKPDAVALLKKDHAEVDALFKRFERARGASRAGIAERICRMLQVHMAIEEEVLYPAAREVLDDEDLIEEAEVEHESGKDLMKKITGTKPGDDRFGALVKVLGEYIKHHVEEEHTELFPKLRKSSLDLKALGLKLAARKRDLVSRKGAT